MATTIEFLLNRARQRGQAGDKSGAMNSYRKVLQQVHGSSLFPRDELLVIYREILDLQLLNKAFDAAEQTCAEIQKIFPGVIDAYLAQVRLRLSQNQYQKALDILLSLQRKVNDIDVLSPYFGRVYMGLKNYYEAYPHLQQTLATLPDQPAVLLDMGWCLIGLERLDEARFMFKSGRKRFPEIAEFQAGLDFVAEHSGETATVVSAEGEPFQEFWSSPFYIHTQNVLVRFLEELGPPHLNNARQLLISVHDEWTKWGDHHFATIALAVIYNLPDLSKPIIKKISAELSASERVKARDLAGEMLDLLEVVVADEEDRTSISLQQDYRIPPAVEDKMKELFSLCAGSAWAYEEFVAMVWDMKKSGMLFDECWQYMLQVGDWRFKGGDAVAVLLDAFLPFYEHIE